MVWCADYEAWGNTATVEWKEQQIDNIAVSEEHLQPIRFQGQSFDTETGLHYNRFRYFDPDMGMFTTRDPIGLLGGNNVFQYAPNPTGWIDPFGLSCVDGSGRPISSPHYSVWQQFEIPVDVQPGSRSQHFRNANEQLYNVIQSNPSLANQLPSEVVSHVQPGSRGGFQGTSPPGQTWHHNAQNPTIIELVPRPQHRAPGPVQQTLHPKNGGGFKQLQADANKC